MDKLAKLPMDGGSLPAWPPGDPMYGLMNALMGNVANLPMNDRALPAWPPEDPMHELMNTLVSNLMFMDNLLKTEDGLQKRGFWGFSSVQNLRANSWNTLLPPFCKGIYLVIRNWNAPPNFQTTEKYSQYSTEQYPGIHELNANWVENALILYVGKSDNLHQRIHELIWSDTSNNPAHDAGKYLWQIEHAEYLKVCWKYAPNEQQEEIEILEAFQRTNQGRLPFANQNKPNPRQTSPSG